MLLQALPDSFVLMRGETVQATISAFGLLQEYGQTLVMVGGKIVPGLPEGRVMIELGASHQKHYLAATKGLLRNLHEAIELLDAEQGKSPSRA